MSVKSAGSSGTKGGLSRSSRFEIEEQKFLKKLPFIAFNLNLRIVERTVLTGDQIRIDDLRYAVPWGHVGQRLLVCIDAHAGKADLYLKDTREFLRTLTLRTPLQGDEPTQVDLLPEELRTCVLNREQLVDHVKSLYGETAHKLAAAFARHSNSMARKHILGLLTRILNETFRKPRSIVQTIKPPKSAEEFGGFR